MQAERDGYVGYVADTMLGVREPAPTHIVSVPRTFLYPGPDLRFPHQRPLSMGSTVTVTGAAETRGTRYALLPSGEALIASHLRPIGDVSRRLCRGRRDVSRHALSLGRHFRLRHRLLGPGATGDAHGGQGRAARFRHAGGEASASRSTRARILPGFSAATWCSGKAMSPS